MLYAVLWALGMIVLGLLFGACVWWCTRVTIVRGPTPFKMLPEPPSGRHWHYDSHTELWSLGNEMSLVEPSWRLPEVNEPWQSRTELTRLVLEAHPT